MSGVADEPTDRSPTASPLLLQVDAVLVRVPSIDEGHAFYRDRLGMKLRWRREGMAAVRLGGSELVLATDLDPETDLLVASVDRDRVVARSTPVKMGEPCKIVPTPESPRSCTRVHAQQLP